MLRMSKQMKLAVNSGCNLILVSILKRHKLLVNTTLQQKMRRNRLLHTEAVPVTKLQTNADTVTSVELGRFSTVNCQINSIFCCIQQSAIS